MRAFICVAVLLLGSLWAASASQAQVVAHSVYYPAPAVVVPATYTQTTVYRPVLRPFSPVVRTVQRPAYVAPQPAVVARPVVPTYASPVPTVTTTRYRPILGGTVTRTWVP
ncbi:hypothetical protein Pan181_25950 [Aeoliella mucimassa]|uniref:Uncharacterized protein n=2 Tax=Aeoliella mucimassa TaxID=2527972 RepID=A0A518ANT2_9BACT|nr:hypothetical protein Pan181_25950 [Aeoliella mucimassa]